MIETMPIKWLKKGSKLRVWRSNSFPFVDSHRKLLTLCSHLDFPANGAILWSNACHLPYPLSALWDVVRHNFMHAVTRKGAFRDTERSLHTYIRTCPISASLYLSFISINTLFTDQILQQKDFCHQKQSSQANLA